MNPLRDGGGRNDHTMMGRGDMPPICAVNTTYNDRLHPPTWGKKATPWLWIDCFVCVEVVGGELLVSCDML